MKLLKNSALLLLCLVLFTFCGKKEGTDTNTNNNNTTNNTDNTNNSNNNTTDADGDGFVKFLSETIANPANKGKKDFIANLIHPGYGIWIVYRMGVGSNVEKYKTMAELSENQAFQGYFQSMSCEKVDKDLPTFDCDANFSKQGCFYQSKPLDNKLLSGYFKEIETFLGEKTEPNKLSSGKEVESKVTHVVILTNEFMALHFAKLDGKYYLLIIDVAKYDCSA